MMGWVKDFKQIVTKIKQVSCIYTDKMEFTLKILRDKEDLYIMKLSIKI